MNCITCSGKTQEVRERRLSQYRDERVETERVFFRCDECGEEFVTPAQMSLNVRAVKNEIRKKYGLLPPERIAAIREKLQLTQSGLEELLGTGPKVVVRWESGKVIQGSGQDNLLRLLERDPSIFKELELIQKIRAEEHKKYEASHRQEPDEKEACAV